MRRLTPFLGPLMALLVSISPAQAQQRRDRSWECCPNSYTSDALCREAYGTAKRCYGRRYSPDVPKRNRQDEDLCCPRAASEETCRKIYETQKRCRY